VKTITEFILTNDNGFFLSLEDKQLSVTVSPNDGDVHFHEGNGPDRLNEYVISGRNVKEFEVTRVRGLIGVNVWFNCGDKTENYFIGFVTDEENAKHWVDRVNTIYRDKRTRMMVRREGFRTGAFMHNPVVHDILAEKQNIILWGDYARSLEGYPPPIYRPEWQKFYVHRSGLYLKQETRFPDEIKDIWQDPPKHRYRQLAERIKYQPRTASDYDVQRVTQPLEFIFDRRQRHDKIAVLPLGKATYFAIIYVPDQLPQSHLELKQDELAAGTFQEFTQRLSLSPSSGRKIRVCTLADTAADYLVDDMIFNRVIDRDQREAMTSIYSMVIWLYDLYQDAMVVCDVGVARQFMHCWRDRHAPFDVQISYVYYDVEVPVGMAYRRDDDMWGLICQRALVDCLQSKESRIQESLAEAKHLLESLGIQWVLTE
jgi:hypothetical protein